MRRAFRPVRALVLRLVGLFTRDGDRGFDEELESHLAMHVDDNLRAGMTPEAARRAALLKLGGLTQTREAYRDRRRLPLLDHVAQDVRFALRTLRKTPGFALIVILTLGLGVGANAAIFSVVNATLLRPLPYPDAGRLVMVYATHPKTGNVMDVMSFPEFEDWRAQSHSFDQMAAVTTRRATVYGDGQAEFVPAVQATPGFFEALGVPPTIGRTFQPGDEQPGTRLVVLGDGGWHHHFGGRPDVLGQTLRINEAAYTVIGVMPPGFSFRPADPELLYLPQERETNRGHGYLTVLARLRPGVTLAQAQSDMDLVARRVSDQHKQATPYLDANGANVIPLNDAFVGAARTGLLIFMGVVALVLLIACTNVANLMLARNVSRQKELALRAALGAGRARLLQQLLTEGLLLALAGGAAGLLLASVTAPLLASVLATHFHIPRLEATHTDAWVLGFTGIVSLATVLLFGGVHAQAAGSRDLQDSLRASTRSATEHVGATRLRRLLVLTEIAVALILLAGAGALLRSLLVLYGTPPGFSTERVLAVDVFMPKRIYSEAPARFQYLDQALSRVTMLPEVQSAAFVSDLPLGGGSDHMSFHIVGRPDPTTGRPFNADFSLVSAGYFATMSIPIRIGREFSHRDTASTPRVIVINETVARRYWPDEDPIGKQISLGADRYNPATGKAAEPMTIIGIAGDVRQRALGIAPEPEIFLCNLQPGPGWPWTTLVARTSVDPSVVAGRIRSAVESVDRGVPIQRVQTLDAIMGASLAQPRVYASLLGVFAALALLLAAVGLYGVMSYTVSQRTHEMGIRMALGAERGDVIRLVLRQALGLALIGTAIGLAGAVAVARLLTSLIPTAQPTNPLTLAAVSALLLVAAFIASYAPARRGSRVDPMIAVREQH